MNWFKIFDTLEEAESQVPIRHMKRVKANRQVICLARDEQGFYAFQNACPHSGGPLSMGRMNDMGEISCPWHGYLFNMRTGTEQKKRCPSLKIYELKIDERGLLIKC